MSNVAIQHGKHLFHQRNLETMWADEGNRISVHNPANGELISDQIPVAGDEDVNAAVEAAQRAFSTGSAWRRMTNFERQQLLLKFANILEKNKEYLAYLSRLTLGAPYLPFGKSEIDTAIGCFRCEAPSIV